MDRMVEEAGRVRTAMRRQGCGAGVRTLVAAAVGVCIAGGAAPARAQDGRGGYFGVELGLSIHSSVFSPLSGISQPTRCDRLLYADRAQAPSDAGCAAGDPRTTYTTHLDPRPGFAGAVSAGYAFAGGPRIEVEYLNRAQGEDESPLESTSDVTQGKLREWSVPPTAGISDFQAHQITVNGYYDFEGDSPLTPYVGVGVGLTRTNLRYRNLYVRRTVDDGYVNIFLDTLDDAARAHFASVGLDPRRVAEAAAGTVSFTNTPVSQDALTIQLLGGVDYALADQVSLGLKARWARFATLTHEAVWERVRSHEPVLADGVTPYDLDIGFEGMAYWAATVGLKYHF